MIHKSILSQREKLYLPLYLLLLTGVSVHSFLGFEYLTPLTLVAPLFIFDFKEVGFVNMKKGTGIGVIFLIPLIFIHPSYIDLHLIANHAGVALAEEIFFRGFLMRKYSNLVVSIMFVIPHVILYPSLGAVLTFFPSLFFGFLYVKFNSLLPSVFAHFSANIFYLGLSERVDWVRNIWEIKLNTGL